MISYLTGSSLREKRRIWAHDLRCFVVMKALWSYRNRSMWQLLLVVWKEKDMDATCLFFFSSYSVWAPNTCNTAPDFRVASPSTVKSLEVPSKPCLEVWTSKLSQDHHGEGVGTTLFSVLFSLLYVPLCRDEPWGFVYVMQRLCMDPHLQSFIILTEILNR